jgi:hypothetical protein
MPLLNVLHLSPHAHRTTTRGQSTAVRHQRHTAHNKTTKARPWHLQPSELRAVSNAQASCGGGQDVRQLSDNLPGLEQKGRANRHAPPGRWQREGRYLALKVSPLIAVFPTLTDSAATRHQHSEGAPTNGRCPVCADGSFLSDAPALPVLDSERGCANQRRGILGGRVVLLVAPSRAAWPEIGRQEPRSPRACRATSSSAAARRCCEVIT